MENKVAIAELSALLKHHSDGYYLYLSNGGKNDPNVELELDALDFAIRCLQDPESLRPKGRWIDEIDLDEFWGELVLHKCSLCNGIQLVQTNYCPNCGAKMEV